MAEPFKNLVNATSVAQIGRMLAATGAFAEPDLAVRVARGWLPSRPQMVQHALPTC